MSKKFIGLVSSLVFLFSCSESTKRQTQDFTKSNRKVANYQENNYCISLRGNGQRMPALWGAIARTVESYGMPMAMSGGSSSTYSMFLTESIFANPYLTAKNEDEKKEQSSFLIKSLMGYAEYLQGTELFRNILKLKDDPKAMKAIEKLMSDMKKISDGSTLTKVFGKIKLGFKYITSARMRRISKVFNHDDTKMLMNGKLFNDYVGASKQERVMYQVLEDPSSSDEQKKKAIEKYKKILAFRQAQFNLALKYFGNYNIKDNANIFFREGPMNFLGFAGLFNRMANFYSGQNFDQKEISWFHELLDHCSKGSKGKTWQEIAPINSKCSKKFKSLVSRVENKQRKSEVAQIQGKAIAEGDFEQRINEVIGTRGIEIIPTTGILIGNSVKKFHEMKKDFAETTNDNFGDAYSVPLDDLRIGYWGSEKFLTSIQSNLARPDGFTDALGFKHNFSDDLKSKLFYSLGQTTWKDVFATSPAEPGLTSIQMIPTRDEILSIGGWMDHLSAPVLKAAGCERVVTITKGDGFGNFGPGMLKRILKLEYPSWSDIQKLMLEGSEEDTTSVWGQYYNRKNPSSSLSLGLKAADAVVCANYDRVGFENGLVPLFNDGYNAPIVFKKDLSDPVLLKHGYSKQLSEGDRNSENPPYFSCFAD